MNKQLKFSKKMNKISQKIFKKKKFKFKNKSKI